MRALGDDVAALRLAIGGDALHKLPSHKTGDCGLRLSDADKEVQESFCVGFKLSCSRNDDPICNGCWEAASRLPSQSNTPRDKAWNGRCRPCTRPKTVWPADGNSASGLTNIHDTTTRLIVIDNALTHCIPLCSITSCYPNPHHKPPHIHSHNGR